MTNSSISRTLLAVATFALVPFTVLAQGLNEETFQRLHDSLNSEQEAWKTIPWETSLLKAQQIAAEQQKPIFIWAMDGHPLGCT